MPEQFATRYPEDAIAGRDDLDAIVPAVAPTLDAQFRERVRRTPDKLAYTEFDGAHWRDYTWSQIAREVARWQAAFRDEGLHAGDRVALQLRNCRHWVIFDQAALGLGLVVVPLYVGDRPENCHYLLEHSDSKLLLVPDLTAWQELEQAVGDLPQLQRVVTLDDSANHSHLVKSANHWLPADGDALTQGLTQPDDLASIVYTSGTTGRPKGVMLSHGNMVMNVYSCLRSVAVKPEDLLLSFLPLSHTLERTVGYYLPLAAGARVAYNRSIPELSDDFPIIRPTGIITVPRIFERAHGQIKGRLENGSTLIQKLFDRTVDIGWARFEYQQGRGKWQWWFLLWPLLDFLVAKDVRQRFGGRMQLVISGGAPLPFPVARVFVALGINILQGYGLTESSPTITVNTLVHNRPATIGLPLHDVEVRIGKDDELLARGPNVMLGYWKNETATREVLEPDGWLHSGDQASIEDGFLKITGRLKDILVLANGEKVPPADMESAIAEDVLFDQTMIVGERMPYLSALVVLNNDLWQDLATNLQLDPQDPAALQDTKLEQELLDRIQKHTQDFPGYAAVRRVSATLEPWTVESGLITPTLKVKRPKVIAHYKDEIVRLYEGHQFYRDDLAQQA